MLREINDEKTWNDILLSLGDAHFLQSWQWGELKCSQGWQAYRYIIDEGGRPVGAFQLLTRAISRRPLLILGYVTRGPVVRSATHLPTVLPAMEEVAREAGCFMLKVDPDFEETSQLGQGWQHMAKQVGWRYSPEQIQPRATAITDLLPDDPDGEAKLLGLMTKRWRYNVGLGPKRGIEAKPVEGNDFHQFYELFRTTGKRQGFGVRNMSYYQEFADRFAHGHQTSAQLFVATHPEEPQPLAGAFLLSFGQRWWYFYGASSERRRADMPTYCLQWTTQRWARNHGGVTYDWWGAPEDPDNKKDSRYSVWHFKKGFGPRHVLGVGAWDKPLKPALYRSYMSVARYRKRFAQLLHKLPF